MSTRPPRLESETLAARARVLSDWITQPDVGAEDEQRQPSKAACFLATVLESHEDAIVDTFIGLTAPGTPPIYKSWIESNFEEYRESVQHKIRLYGQCFGGRTPGERERAREEVLRLAREQGRRCASEDNAEIIHLTRPAKVQSIGLARIVIDRYADELSAEELGSTLLLLNGLLVESAMAHIQGYMSFKEELLEQQRDTLSELLDELAEVEANERWSLAMNLHDDLAQKLVSVSTAIQHCQRMIGQKPEALRDELTAVAKGARDIISDTRSLIRDLHFVTDAREQGDFSELGEYVRDMQAETAIDHSFDVSGAEWFSDAERTQIVRIVHEALTNAYKHAKARRIEVVISGTPGGFHVGVADDGLGFDAALQAEPAPRAHHFGLTGMHKRARFLGASLTIRTAPMMGTTIDLRREANQP